MNPRGLLSLLVGILLFSTIEVTSKRMQLDGGIAGQYPFWLASLRFIITGIVLFIPAMIQLRHHAVTMRDVGIFAGLGLLGVTCMSSLYHLSITYLPANVAALVFSCNPVFVMLLAPLFLAEKITKRKCVAVGLCLIGIGVLAGDRAQGVSVLGLGFMLMAILIFALYTLLFKKMTPRYGALPITAFAGLIGGLFILPIALSAEGFPLLTYATVDWLGIAYLAVIGTALAYFLFIYGMGQVEASVGSMAFFLKPFLAALLAWWVLGEGLTLSMWIGGWLILGGMMVALIRFRKRTG